MERIKILIQHRNQFTRKGVITKKLKQISAELIEIEAEFLDKLFDRENKKTFQELYSIYSVAYYLAAHTWNKKTIDLIEVNLQYFVQQYYNKS